VIRFAYGGLTSYITYKFWACLLDIQDYKVKVVDVAFLDDAVIERFTSDFKLVAKFFKSRRLGTKPWDDET